MSFYVGQKVVCVDAKQRGHIKPELQEGKIYVIKTCEITIWGRGVTLAEQEPHEGYIGWYADRFCPVEERKTSIEIFHKMLTNAFIEREIANVKD